MIGVKLNSNDFWCLMEELSGAESGITCERSIILEAYKNGNLYGLSVIETDEMYKRRACEDKIFCHNTFYLLPCFCIKENDKAICIWTHTRARRNGFAKKLVELLQIENVYNLLQDSIEFWKKCNVKIILIKMDDSDEIDDNDFRYLIIKLKLVELSQTEHVRNLLSDGTEFWEKM